MLSVKQCWKTRKFPYFLISMSELLVWIKKSLKFISGELQGGPRFLNGYQCWSTGVKIDHVWRYIFQARSLIQAFQKIFSVWMILSGVLAHMQSYSIVSSQQPFQGSKVWRAPNGPRQMCFKYHFYNTTLRLTIPLLVCVGWTQNLKLMPISFI